MTQRHHSPKQFDIAIQENTLLLRQLIADLRKRAETLRRTAAVMRQRAKESQRLWEHAIKRSARIECYDRMADELQMIAGDYDTRRKRL